MSRELNSFGCLRQALVQVQTRSSLGRRPRPSPTHTQPFRPLLPEKPIHLVTATRLTKALSSNLSTQLRRAQTRNKASLLISAPRSGPPSNARFGADTSGSDYTTHRIRKDMKPSTKPTSVNGENFYTWRVGHHVSRVTFLLCPPCHK